MAYRNTLLQNNIYVDSINGNDATAVKYNLLHPYGTIAQARTVATFGDTIIVFPGSYLENLNLFKNGISYYFYPEAVVESTAAVPLFGPIAGEKCEVYGHGDFRNISIGGVVNSTAQGTLIMECNNIFAVSNPISTNDGFIDIKCYDIVCDNNAAINFLDSAFGVGDNYLLIKCNSILSNSFSGNNPTINNGTGGPGYDGRVHIEADKIYGSPNSDNRILFADNFVVPFARTTVEILCNEFVITDLTGSREVLEFIFTDNTKWIIKGNLTIPSGNRVGLITNFPNNNSEIIFDGEITTDLGDAATLVGSNGIVRLNGKFKSNGTQTILVASIPSKVYLDGEIINTEEAPPP